MKDVFWLGMQRIEDGKFLREFFPQVEKIHAEMRALPSMDVPS